MSRRNDADTTVLSVQVGLEVATMLPLLLVGLKRGWFAKPSRPWHRCVRGYEQSMVGAIWNYGGSDRERERERETRQRGVATSSIWGTRDAHPLHVGWMHTYIPYVDLGTQSCTHHNRENKSVGTNGLDSCRPIVCLHGEVPTVLRCHYVWEINTTQCAYLCVQA